MENVDEKTFEDAGRTSIVISALKDFVVDWILKKFTVKQGIDFVEVTASLLNNPTKENIKKSKDLLLLHRHYENTKARRRLEKWSSRVISAYLMVVATLLILNYNNSRILFIPDKIMVIILTTTTINVIGLVIIVLRGYFHNKNEEAKEMKSSDNKIDSSSPNN